MICTTTGGAPRALTLAATLLPGDLAAPAHDEHGAAARLAGLDEATGCDGCENNARSAPVAK